MGDERIFVTFVVFRAKSGRSANEFELQISALLEKNQRAAAMRWEVLSLPPGLLPAHTRCPALVPCSAAGCAILHAPQPCLSTGGRIGCDRRSQFPLPTVCLLVRDPPPHPSKRARRLAYLHTPASITPRHRCTCPHLPIPFRAYAQSLCLQILCRSAIDFAHPRPRAVALAGAFDAVVAAVKSPGLPPEPQRDSSCCIVNGCWFCCLPDAVRALLADAAPTARPCDVEAKANGSRDARHIAWCVRLLRVVGAS